MSNSDLMLDVDQAGELKAAFRRGDWTNAEIKRLCEGDTLKSVRGVIRGLSEIKPIQHAIDCSARPFVLDGWRVLPEDQLPNRVKGTFTWDPTKVRLYLSRKQQGSNYMSGHELCKELASQPVFPANVLDYLLKPENQHLISWVFGNKNIVFWGTIYRDSGDDLCVRFLDWNGIRWYWSYSRLASGFSSSRPALVRAS